MKIKQTLYPMTNKHFLINSEPVLFNSYNGQAPDIKDYIQVGPPIEVEFEAEDLTKKELTVRFELIKKQQIEAQIAELQKELTA